MNRRVASITIFVLLTALCGFGASKAHKRVAQKKSAHKISAQSRFQFAPTKGPAKEFLERARAGGQKQSSRPGAAPARVMPGTGPRSMGQKARRQGILGNPPPTQIGFVSAIQIPAGGYLPSNQALAGDLDGDGNMDVVSLVGDPSNPGSSFSISVVLGNGDGTFLPAVLTPVPGNDGGGRFVIGDVDGDGLDDVIVVHQPGSGPGIIHSNASTFDVMLSNGDGTLFNNGNFWITDNYLSAGTLALDASGFLDLVAVDSASPSNVWTVTGNGDGTFSSTPTSVALSGPAGYDVAVADLDGDGLLDITGSDYNTHHQTVFLALSATTFADGADNTTSDGVYDACSTAIGDLTGDGLPEIVNSNCSDGTVTVYVNNGDGSFAQGVYAAVASAAGGDGIPDVYPEAATIADVNGDGVNDIVSVNDDSSDVTILFGNGDGTFSVPTVGYAAGGFLYNPAIVADFNGDGLVDIIVPDDTYSLAYMKGYGDGTFRAALDYYSPVNQGGSADGNDVATGDFNGDGLPDVVVGNFADVSTGITVFLSRPDGSLLPGVNYGSGGGMAHVAVADLDGDGKLDIAASDGYYGVVQIFNGVGDGTFTTGSSYPTDSSSTSPQGIVVADFNQDGFPDLAVANSEGSNIGVLLNDGLGGFATLHTYATCSGTQQVTAVDVNGDGYPDLMAPLPSCVGMALLLNTADGTGAFAPETDFGVGATSPWQVAVGDLNGDGKMDYAVTVANWGNPIAGVAVALGNGDGTFGVPTLYATSLQSNNWENPYPTGIKMVDLDGDGNLDLIYNNTDYGTVGVLYGRGDGTFYDPVEYPMMGYGYALALADVNGDGAVDVVAVTADGLSGVSVLLNNSGTKALPDYAVTADPPSQTITAGSSAVFTITVSPNNFYNGTITFSCGTLPAESSCTFSPTSLTPNGNGQMTTTLTIHTTAASASLQAPAGLNPNQNAPSLWASLSGIGVFGLMLAGDWKKKRNRRMGIILGLLVLGMMFSLVGCGGSSNQGGGGGGGNAGTPAGPYTIAVTATGTAGTTGGNTAAHNMSLSLTVQ